MLSKVNKSLIILFGLVVCVVLTLVYGIGLDGDEQDDLFKFVGRFHPVLLHSPIVLVALLALFELIAWKFKSIQYQHASRLILLLLTGSIWLAFLSGYLLAYGSGSNEQLVQDHMFWGAVFLIISNLACLLNYIDMRRGYIACLILALLASFQASHLGGSLTHGSTYLTEYAPNLIRPLLGLKRIEERVIQSPDELLVYDDVIYPMFKENCITCHNPDKQKGDLRMDTYEGLLLGGEAGPSVTAKNLEKSELYRRITLPAHEKEFMPSDGRKPLSENEVKVVEWWIKQGAPSKGVVGDYSDRPVFLESYTQQRFLKLMSPEKLAELEERRLQLYETIESLNNELGVILVPEKTLSSIFVLNTIHDRDLFTGDSLVKLDSIKEHIISMDLSETPVDDSCFSTLANFKNLRHLVLKETQVTGSSIELLSGLEHLEVINLFASQLTDEGLAKLVDFKNLKRVYVANTEVTETAVEELRELLPQLKVSYFNAIEVIAAFKEKDIALVKKLEALGIKSLSKTPNDLFLAKLKSNTKKYGLIINKKQVKVSVSSDSVHTPQGGLEKFFGPIAEPLNFAFHSAPEKKSWVRLDLNSKFTLTSFYLMNRMDGGASIFERAKGLELQRLKDDGKWETIWTAKKFAKSWAVDLTGVNVSKRKAKSYRFIINNDKESNFHLSNLLFFGIEETMQFGTLLNQEIKVSVISDSEYSLGNNPQDFVSIKESDLEHTFHTDEESQPWVRLDFDEKHRINYFHLKNRSALFERSKGLQFERLKEDGKWESIWKSEKAAQEWRVNLMHLKIEQREAQSYRFIIYPPSGKTYMHPKHVSVFGEEASAPDHSSSESNPTLDVTGDGEWTYIVENGWGKVPGHDHIGSTHGGVVVDKAGNVYVSTDGPNGIIVYDENGEFLRTLAEDSARCHGLCINEEEGKEYIYAAVMGHMVKFDLSGNIVMRIEGSKIPEHQWQKGTAVAVAPNGDIFIADGYGSNIIFKYNKNGDFIKKFGLRGRKEGQFITCHGLIVDKRNIETPLLIVCDRENKRLQHFDLEGNFVKIPITGLRRPCAMAIWSDYMVVAELAGRAVLLDKDYRIISKLGDNPEVKQRANFGVNPKDWKEGVFTAPHGCSFDAKGNIYVQDWNKWGRITKLQLKKNLTEGDLEKLLKNKVEFSKHQNHQRSLIDLVLDGIESDPEKYGVIIKNKQADVNVSSVSTYAPKGGINKFFGPVKEPLTFSFCTEKENKPWIQLDLKSQFTITGFHLMNRTDGGTGIFKRAKGLELQRLKDDKTWETIWKAKEFGESWTVDLTDLDVVKRKSKSYRYILNNEKTSFFHLSNLSLFGIEDTTQFGHLLNNLIKVSVISDSEYSFGNNPQDFVSVKEPEIDYTFHTDEESQPWVRLDFKEKHRINYFHLKNRPTLFERSKGLQLERLKEDGKWESVWKSKEAAKEWRVNLTDLKVENRESKSFRFIIYPTSGTTYMHPKYLRVFGEKVLD